MGAFHFQRRELARVWGDQVRMVFYDQRGHGKSGTAAPRTYTVAQLGCDLDTVLTVMAPRGSVILVGHSMGGMTVLSHARQFPRRYGTSIVGAAIISSAAEGLSRSPLGEILQNPALEAARLATRYAPNLVHRGRGAVRSVLSPILQAASFGDSAVSPTVARYSEHMIHDTPVTTMVGFLHALGVHDETDGLPVLAKVPTLIACGSADTLTLPDHSEEMAAVLPKAELLVVGGAGHLVQLEQPDPIDDALVRLVERATPNKLQAITRRVRDRVRPRGARATDLVDDGPAVLATAEDMIALGERLGAGLRAGDVVVLSGPLGAGKTVLAKGIASALDVDGPVTSPTFVLARVHPARRSGDPAMVHVDVYRLLDHAAADLLAELDSLDLDTDLDDAVVVVEWGEGLAERLSDHHLDVQLERAADSEVRTATWRWSTR